MDACGDGSEDVDIDVDGADFMVKWACEASAKKQQRQNLVVFGKNV